MQPQIDDGTSNLLRVIQVSSTCHTETNILTGLKSDKRQHMLDPHSLVPYIPGVESCGLGGVLVLNHLGLEGMFDHAPLTL